jgi:ubiquinone/menaquinone biosynthesis C-methylase UbiE
MPRRLYDDDPLTLGEREEFERDLISFSDRELDLLGDIRGLDVLYAGGSSPLWIEGLSQRIGEAGSLTALDGDAERIREAEDALRDADLAAPVRLVVGDVFGPPFGSRTFDLVYSAGLFHELDVRERNAGDALAALLSVTRPGGRVATSDFVDSVPAIQLEDEQLQRELAREASGAELFGIGAPERLVELHEECLENVRWRLLPPFEIRHLDKVVLAEDDPAGQRLRGPFEALRDLIRREGYTRPAALYVEGFVTDG